MTDYDKLLNESLRVYCKECDNWRTVSCGMGSYSGCACCMNPKLCTLNPLANKLKKIREGKEEKTA